MMKRHGWALATALLACLLLALLGPGEGRSQQVLQYGFETRDPVWVQGPHDAAYKELVHRITEPPEPAHSGDRSEFIRVKAEQGTFIHYLFEIGRAPVVEELTASLFVRSNRPGTQLLARVVFPKERDPKDPQKPLTALIHGDSYQLTGRWQQLVLRQPTKRLREQHQLLQNELKRPVDATDAFIDRLVLNVYGGPGTNEVWLDDLEVGPILDAKPKSAAGAPARPGAPTRPARRRETAVVLKGKQLVAGGERIFLRGIRHTGTPLAALKRAGFNTVWLDESTPAGLVDDAVNLGFWIVPMLTPPALAENDGGRTEGKLTTNEAFGRQVARWLDHEALICWDLGSNLQYEQFTRVAQTAQSFHAADPMRPVAADVWDGFPRYARGVEHLMLGIHRWPLMTSLELPAYRDWLVGRRRLAQLGQPDVFCWTWVQTHLPDWFTTLVYDRPGVSAFNEPIGPQAEQIRLLAYTAIGAGYRGLAYWSDRFLADSHAGRDRLLSLALLNMELRMLEPLLTTAEEPKWINSENRAEVKAAVMRTERAILVLPVWLGNGSQYVPAQDAMAKLDLVVPDVPPGYQPLEVSPGRVRTLDWRRVTGGHKITLDEFSLTSIIVFTADLGRPDSLQVRFQNEVRANSRLAAQYAHDQAEEELAKVSKVEAELEQAGHTLPDGAKLLEKAREYLDRCQDHRRSGAHGEAYLDAQRALRPVRILMRAQWEKALKGYDVPLDTPVASPYAVSFFTLPRHWRLMDQLRGLQPAANVLPDGNFESPSNQKPAGWLMQEAVLDDVKTRAVRVAEAPQEGRQCLLLEIKPKDEQLPPLALQRTFLAVHSPAVHLPPGTWVRISAWVKIPAPIGSSPDGALLYDDAGGEPLAVRLTAPTKSETSIPGTAATQSSPWKKYTLYRQVPAKGTINVTLALTGLGKVYFDDVRIEPLVAGGAPVTAAKVRGASR
jgi:hypothetical protein